MVESYSYDQNFVAECQEPICPSGICKSQQIIPARLSFLVISWNITAAMGNEDFTFAWSTKISGTQTMI